MKNETYYESKIKAIIDAINKKHNRNLYLKSGFRDAYSYCGTYFHPEFSLGILEEYDTTLHHGFWALILRGPKSRKPTYRKLYNELLKRHTLSVYDKNKKWIGHPDAFIDIEVKNVIDPMQ